MSTLLKKKSNCLNQFDQDVFDMWQKLLDKQFPLNDKILFLSERSAGYAEEEEARLLLEFRKKYTQEVFDSDFGLEVADGTDTEMFYEEGEVVMNVSSDRCHKRLVKMHSILVAYSKGEDVVPVLMSLGVEVDTESLLNVLMNLMGEWKRVSYN